VLSVAIALHASLLFYDAHVGFSPFLHGDRAPGRFAAMLYVVHAPLGDWLSFMAQSGVVPGEYLLQIPAYLLGGIPAVIGFQVAMTIGSVLAVAEMAKVLFRWTPAPWVAGVIYLILPDNLVFPHQFVTEAVAAPMAVGFMALMMRLTDNAMKQVLATAAAAGLCLGLAIFSRPSLAVALPALGCLYVLYQRTIAIRPITMGVVCAVAVAPLLIWTVLFTASSGHIGYTNGVATLGWNLRSKVYIEEQAGDFPKSPEVSKFTSYANMSDDHGGIGVVRFFQIEAKHPSSYLNGLTADLVTVMVKADTTKMTVDYLGLNHGQDVKAWREVLDSQGLAGLRTWATSNHVVLFISLVELVGSAMTSTIAMLSLGSLTIGLVRPKAVSAEAGPRAMSLLLSTGALLAAVLASAVMVDRAQARLRHPAEAGMLLLAGFAISQLRRSYMSKPAATLRAEPSAKAL
jgi:hypothetical protein